MEGGEGGWGERLVAQVTFLLTGAKFEPLFLKLGNKALDIGPPPISPHIGLECWMLLFFLLSNCSRCNWG